MGSSLQLTPVILRDKMFLLASLLISIGSSLATSVDTRSNFSIKEADVRSCPHGWVSGQLVDMGCLLFDVSSGYTWEEPNNFCESVGGALVEVPTVEGMASMQMMLEAIQETNGPRYWWTGGNDIGDEGFWSWGRTGMGGNVGEFTWYWDGCPRLDELANCQYVTPGVEYMACDWDCQDKNYPLCQIL